MCEKIIYRMESLRIQIEDKADRNIFYTGLQTLQR